jgi:hypothetical protein
MGDGKIRFALLSLMKKPAKSGAFNYRQILKSHHGSCVSWLASHEVGTFNLFAD